MQHLPVRIPSQTPPSSIVACLLVWVALMAGCSGARIFGSQEGNRPAGIRPAGIRPADARAMIAEHLPPHVSDPDGWTNDIYAGFSVLGIEPNRKNICAVVAVIEQESGFRVDPVIPGLPAIAWREIDERAAHADLPRPLVHGLLQLKSTTGHSYAERIDAARTEHDLSGIYEDLLGSVPLGRTLFADRDPIRTRGPMQVHVAFAERFTASRPYPYPVKVSIENEVFSRRGGVYFGIAHLLAYPAPDDYRFRFADYNAGQYASRNAAFQAALGIASGIVIVRDGALMGPQSAGETIGETELAARSLGSRVHLDEDTIHRALELGKSEEFERTPLYQRVFELADHTDKRALPRAEIPHIELHGPKLSRKLTTEWYAKRVDGRFERCLKAGR